MAENVWDYFEERDRECKRLSLRPDADAFYEAEAGSDDKRGLMILRLDLSPRAFLAVKEEVVVREGGYIHRESYAYFLVIDGQEYAGWERDPSHDPAEHGHGPGHERVDTGRVTFKQAVELSWEILSKEEELTGGDLG